MAVLAWGVKLPPEFKSVYFYTIGRCGENGGKIALDWCLENKEYFPLHYGIHTLAEYVAPAPAVAWCMQAPEEVHHLAFGSTAMGWAYRDPVGAATWFSELKAPLDARRSVAYGIAFGWVHSYPKDALAATTWVVGIKSKEERLSAIYGISAMWIRHNISPATAWIKTLGDKEELRAAVSGAFKTIQMGIADKVSGGGLYDAAYAKEWLDQFPLSDLDKTYIIHTADKDLAIHGSKIGKIVWPQ